MSVVGQSVEARDAAIEAVLPLVPRLGWSMAALREAAGDSADLLFPGGPADMVDAYIDLADRRMMAATDGFAQEKRVSGRVRALILERLRQAEPHRDAVRRAFGILAMPANAALAARGAARTVDRIWNTAGDRSADFSWYTKRAILGVVYGATLLYWMRPDVDDAAVAAFLDRRLARVAAMGKLSARLKSRRGSGAPAKP
jgi:ubiquinone biosynthesis protein COQ9